MFLKRAREPYEPNMSAAMMTPPVNFTPSTDVPVTIGLLQREREGERGEEVYSDHADQLVTSSERLSADLKTTTQEMKPSAV